MAAPRTLACLYACCFLCTPLHALWSTPNGGDHLGQPKLQQSMLNIAEESPNPHQGQYLEAILQKTRSLPREVSQLKQQAGQQTHQHLDNNGNTLITYPSQETLLAQQKKPQQVKMMPNEKDNSALIVSPQKSGAVKDKLVLELENLHLNKEALKSRNKAVEKKRPSTSYLIEETSNQLHSIIEVLHSLGVTNEEIMKMLQYDDHKFTDFPERNHHFNPEFETGMGFNNHEENSNRKALIQRMKDIQDEENFYLKTNSERWKSTMEASDNLHKVHPGLINNTILNKHMNIPASHISFPPEYSHKGVPHISFQNNQSHHITLKDAIQNLQKPNYRNLIMKDYMMDASKYYPVNQYHNGFSTGSNRQNKFDLTEIKFPNLASSSQHFAPHSMRHGYGPYPYSHRYNKNATLQGLEVMAPLPIKALPNPKKDTQLSEEMKRELRDGKIIVLSDSLVRSNFATKVEKEKENENTEKVKTTAPDINNTESTIKPNTF